MADQKEYSINETTGTWLGWIGIIAGLIGFAWQPIFMPIVALVLGIITIQSPKRTIGWISVAVGAVALIVGLV
ncbi:MAG: C4-dicarboxylate ABC transporter [Firmicutes bacterium]|jgi:hypothetical protein|nr:C4-dicarboxylate ABC transporter [Bacillota bacterium]